MNVIGINCLSQDDDPAAGLLFGRDSSSLCNATRKALREMRFTQSGKKLEKTFLSNVGISYYPKSFRFDTIHLSPWLCKSFWQQGTPYKALQAPCL